MKQQRFTFLLTMLFSLMGTMTFAHDIEINNGDGVIIYYVWTNNETELAVSYQGNSGFSGGYYKGNVEIPQLVTYEGKTYKVTEIGTDAFSFNSDLTSVTIPNTVKSIGTYAFQYCFGLTSINIPNSVTSLERSSFNSCKSLTT